MRWGVLSFAQLRGAFSLFVLAPSDRFATVPTRLNCVFFFKADMEGGL